MASTTAPVENDSELVHRDQHPESVPPEPTARASGRGIVVGTVATAVIAITAAVVAGVSWSILRTEQASQERDEQIVATARQVVVNLVTLRHQSADEDLQRVADGTTGQFRDQFTGAAGSFDDVLSQGQVESTGEVKEAGLVEADDRHAVVLAAVTSTVKNTEAPDGERRMYRMKVTLDAVDGRWLVSDVEFVA
ncbi:hypothetical protein F8M49_20165 [Rhodococcus zopfii]|uniref:Mce-associated membrane protein n=1 Tax=Rhodococcus zopfii TaxID=43772 RepID=A0ABU3WST3_9NOCA|nr:hypothetical protein [Rhodococcus zopfii]